jgi:hypothetical protein
MRTSIPVWFWHSVSDPDGDSWDILLCVLVGQYHHFRGMWHHVAWRTGTNILCWFLSSMLHCHTFQKWPWGLVTGEPQNHHEMFISIFIQACLRKSKWTVGYKVSLYQVIPCHFYFCDFFGLTYHSGNLYFRKLCEEVTRHYGFF